VSSVCATSVAFYVTISVLVDVQSTLQSAYLVSVVSSGSSIFALVAGGKLGEVTVVVTLPSE